jgi:hypothetical protein
MKQRKIIMPNKIQNPLPERVLKYGRDGRITSALRATVIRIGGGHNDWQSPDGLFCRFIAARIERARSLRSETTKPP